ncbi:MAG: hypothetical protein J7501_12590 [Bdellovibrio sp.]|nr:hypothetical protein [Bdellovibrio sp.]
MLDAFFTQMSVTKVERYFDLTPQQKKEFQENVEKDLQRLRQERLDDIARSLRGIDKKVAAAKKDDEVLAYAYTTIQKQYNVSSSYLKTSATKLTKSLREDQFQTFKDKVEKEISADRNTSVEDKNADLLARYRKSFKYWIGEMSQEQNQSLDKFITVHQFPWKEKIDNRQQILNSFIEARKDSVKLRRLTEQFMVDYDSLRTPEYAKAVDQYETQFKNFLNKFWTTLSPAQKKQMHVSLMEQVNELEKLARSSSGPL